MTLSGHISPGLLRRPLLEQARANPMTNRQSRSPVTFSHFLFWKDMEAMESR